MNRCVAIAIGTGLACGLAGAGIVALADDDTTHTLRIEGPGAELLTELSTTDTSEPFGEPLTWEPTWEPKAPPCAPDIVTHAYRVAPMTCQPSDGQVVILLFHSDDTETQRQQVCDSLDGDLLIEYRGDESACRWEFR